MAALRLAMTPLMCMICLGGGCARPQGELFLPVTPAVVWPAPPETPRIKLVGTLAGSKDLKAAESGGEVFRAAFRGPRPPIKFTAPHAMAFGPAELLAIADGGGSAVHIIDLGSREHRIITGWDDQRFDIPLGVAWIDERLFVADARRHEIIELDAQGRYRGRFGTEVLRRPVGMVYAPGTDRIYVVDGGAHCLKIFAPSGSHMTTIGRHGTGPGEFNFPTHIALAGDRLLVADTGNFRVQLLDLDGRCINTIGQKGNAAGDFAMPKGVAFDADGHIYVVDSQFENVQIFDTQGRLLLAFGQEGSAQGRFWLPAGLTIDRNNRIWVADSGNRRLQVFAYVGESS